MANGVFERFGTPIHNFAVQQEIEAALRRLPILDPPTACEAIPYSVTIPGIARHILLMARPNPAVLNRRATAFAELERIETAAIKLAAMLADQRRDPLATQDYSGRLDALHYLTSDSRLKVLELGQSLDGFIAAAREAAQKVPKRPKARPKAVEKDKIGFYLAEEYRRLTGKFPSNKTNSHHKIYGDFYDLLADIFKTLGLSSPEATARKVVAERKQAARS